MLLDRSVVSFVEVVKVVDSFLEVVDFTGLLLLFFFQSGLDCFDLAKGFLVFLVNCSILVVDGQNLTLFLVHFLAKFFVFIVHFLSMHSVLNDLVLNFSFLVLMSQDAVSSVIDHVLYLVDELIPLWSLLKMAS